MKLRVTNQTNLSWLTGSRYGIHEKFLLTLLVLSLTLVYAPSEAQNKAMLINQYNEQLLSNDFVLAHKTIKKLLAVDPDNFDFQREHIKVLGAMNEKDSFIKEMLSLRQNGSPVAIQNFYSIIDAKEVPEEFKQILKSHFEQENDSYILGRWEKSIRDKPLIKIGTPQTTTGMTPQVSSQPNKATEQQQTPVQSDTSLMTEEERRDYEMRQKQIEQRMKEDATKIEPEDDPGFTRH